MYIIGGVKQRRYAASDMRNNKTNGTMRKECKSNFLEGRKGNEHMHAIDKIHNGWENKQPN